jgi:hypothetical protein
MDSKNRMASVASVPMTALNSPLHFHGHESPIGMCHALLLESEKGAWTGGRTPPIFMAGEACHRISGLHLTSAQNLHAMISDNTRIRYSNHCKILSDSNATNTAFWHSSSIGSPISETMDTVGVIIIDNFGYLYYLLFRKMASASSSGGISLKQSGRVGSAAIIGSGILVSNNEETCIGVTCSGSGESIMQTRFATKIEQACRFNIPLSEIFMPNIGCLICIKDGKRAELLWPHTTDSFCVLYATDTQTVFQLSRTHCVGSLVECGAIVAC